MPIKYIPYYPNTVEGQAILDNITRTQRVLRYRENDKVYDRIKRGMPYYEVEPLETVGEPSENLVIRGECISACAYLKEKGIKVDLVCIDPPFASGADYAKSVYLRRNPKLAAKVAAAEQEMDIDELKAFEEKMYGDIWQKEDYLNWMYENLIAIKSIMTDEASIYVHLDWHIGHYVKILMDEVFGEDNFKNEIIWQKLKAAKGQANSFGNVHDMIFYYSNSNEKFIHNKQYVPHSEQRIKQHYNNFDEKANKNYSLDSFTQTGQGEARNFGKHGILEPPAGKHWIWSQENIDKGLEDGLIIFTSKGKPRVKRYLEDSNGIAIGDIWTDINPVNSQADEDADYSTQKPVTLLERIINASSNKGMMVADFFGGSGVTAKASQSTGRKFIHVDIGINSILTVRDGLKEAKANFQILEIKDGVSLFRNPQQTMDKLATLIPGLQKGVKGISNFWFGAITKSKEGIVPVYVPNLLNTQEKVLDIPTINTIINQELQNLEVNAKKVIVYYIDIDDQKALEKFIKDNNATEIEVELKDLKNLLHDVVIEDIIDFKTTKTKDGYETEITKFISDRLIQKIGEFNQKGNLQSVAKGKKFNPINISEEGLELIELIALDCENTEGQWHSTTEIKIDKLGYVITNGVKSKNFWDGKIISDKKPLRIKVRNISGDETIKTAE
jgi:adenine-specific DNA-methyltransferase